MSSRPIALVVAIATALVLAACSGSGSHPTGGSIGTAAARVLLVGSYHGHAGDYSTIQAAVDAAKPGDWVLVAPGDYHERNDHAAKTTDDARAGVLITTPNVHIRGMDRNGVVIDGTRPGASPCSAKTADQDLGPGRNGLEVWKASGTTIENLTVCNFVSGARGGGNQIWWNGGNGSGEIGLHAYGGSYLSATSTYATTSVAASSGIVVSNSDGPGVIDTTYASNMASSAYYLGACPDCNANLDHAHAQYSALGYSATNAGGHVVVQNSEFDHNRTGVSTSSRNNDSAPAPQDGRCPGGETGPTGTRSCWFFQNNNVHDNNNVDVAGASTERATADLAPPGAGMVIAGGRYDTVINNRFKNNGSWAMLVAPFPDTGTPPPVAHCVGGEPNGVPGLGIAACYYDTWGNDIAHNAFVSNGGFDNPTNGDLGELSSKHDPGNCWHENTDPDGLTTAPAKLQKTNGTCGDAHEGAQPGSRLTSQVYCATQVFKACTSKPETSYPRRTKIVLPPLTEQKTMPNPCKGVPDNVWCVKGEPIT